MMHKTNMTLALAGWVLVACGARAYAAGVEEVRGELLDGEDVFRNLLARNAGRPR